MALGFAVAALPAISQVVQAATATVSVSPGNHGPEVATVQTDLHALGYYRSAVDGLYGPLLGAAVRNFQSSQPLASNGVVGPLTWRYLHSALQEHRALAATLVSATRSGPALHEGITGSAVVHLQHLLNRFGAGLATDGNFGPLTLSALQRFQRTHGLAVTTAVDSATWSALAKDTPPAAPVVAAAKASPPSKPAASQDGSLLQEGATGSAVVHLQQRLNAFGAHLATDGDFGPLTLEALLTFQRAHGLPASGVVDAATWSALSETPPAPKPAPAPAPTNSSPSVLRLGDRGPAVLTLQKDLTSIGYNTYGEDGIFGPDTEAAVKAFESHEGLTVDGIAGPAVWHALEAALSTDRGSTATQSRAAAIVGFARSLVGDPYRWGGTSPTTGFDCSGLVQYVFAHFGISLPRTSYAQYDVGTHVAYDQLQPGDLVFFATNGSGASHVGIYIGGGEFIGADTYATGVHIDSFSISYWMAHFVGATVPPGL